MRLFAYLIWESLKPFGDYFKAAIFGVTLAPWIKALAETLWGDLQFSLSMAIVVGANALLKFAVDFKYKRLGYKPFVSALGLVCVYAIALVVFHQAAKSSSLMSWLDAAIYGAIMAVECLRCIESLAHLGIVVPSFIKVRLRSFTDTGEPVAVPTESQNFPPPPAA
jgi:hypothetical protein